MTFHNQQIGISENIEKMEERKCSKKEYRESPRANVENFENHL